MIKVIKNGTVISMDNKREKIENVDIVIKDDTIIDIVNNYTGEYDKLIDAKGKIVMPGLINTHTHLGMSVFRATNDNLSLNDWLTKKIWPIEDNLTGEEIYQGVLLSCLEMIKSGTTCSNDMYFKYPESIKALEETKVRSFVGWTLMDSTNDGDKRIEEFKKFYESNKSKELIKFTVAPHAFYTCSSEYLKRCSNLALELDLPLHIHFCENEGEVNGIKNDYNCLPVEALEKNGMLRNKLVLAHCTFISDKELEILKDKDVSFVHNPLSNLNLGCGIADICKYRKYVNVCLGTDGQGSGNNMNLFYHMSLVDLLQKGLYKDPTVFSSYETLKMATINGAKALGIDNLVGSIEIGKKADIIIIDMNKIETYPTVDLITNLVHNTTINNVDTTIINGEVLMENQELLLNIDINKLKENINKIIDKVI